MTIATDTNNDGTLSNAELGAATTVTVSVALPAGAAVGDTLNVSLNGVAQTPIVLTQAQITNGVTFDVARPADGQSVSATATVTDTAGNTSAPGSDSAVVGDTTATAAPTVTIATDTNNDGTLSNAELGAATT
ncbi:hypothetical protein HUW63_43155, partial [Myxococcus sp. AM001]|nr:hypothetical protein [Myxococcus sp. AM001]